MSSIHIKGFVNIVQPVLCYFELESSSRYYLINQRKTVVNLPQYHLTEEVDKIVSKYYFQGNTCLVFEDDDTFSNYVVSSPQDSLVSFIFANKLFNDYKGLIHIDTIIRKLELLAISDFCVLEIIKRIWNLSLCPTFNMIKFYTPNDLNFVNETYTSQYEKMLFTKNDFTVFNAYPSHINGGGFLVGLLTIFSYMGHFLLKDSNKSVIIKFTASARNQHSFINRIIIIKKFILFTETFKELDKGILQYFLVDENDIELVPNTTHPYNRYFYVSTEDISTKTETFLYRYIFAAIRVSDVCASYEKQSTCYIQGILFEGEIKVNVILVLPLKLLHLNQFIKERSVYCICTDKAIKILPITDIKEFKPYAYCKRMIIDSNANSVVQQIEATGQYILNDTFFSETFDTFEKVENCISECRNSAKLVNIKLKISRKTLNINKYKSFIPLRHSGVNYFGDICGRQQQITYKNSEITINGAKFIDLYLCDRENFVVPLGLFPNMVVLIKNVTVYKNKSLKASLFTNFEVVGYEPNVMFSSACLYTGKSGRLRWQNQTKPCNLGLYNTVPNETIVYAILAFNNFVSLQIKPCCNDCRKEHDEKIDMFSCSHRIKLIFRARVAFKEYVVISTNKILFLLNMACNSFKVKKEIANLFIDPEYQKTIDFNELLAERKLKMENKLDVVPSDEEGAASKPPIEKGDILDSLASYYVEDNLLYDVSAPLMNIKALCSRDLLSTSIQWQLLDWVYNDVGSDYY